MMDQAHLFVDVQRHFPLTADGKLLIYGLLTRAVRMGICPTTSEKLLPVASIDAQVLIVLVLSLMVLIFLGPEWMGTFGRKPKRFKKRVRIATDSRIEPVVGRRRSNRPVTSQSPS